MPDAVQVVRQNHDYAEGIPIYSTLDAPEPVAYTDDTIRFIEVKDRAAYVRYHGVKKGWVKFPQLPREPGPRRGRRPAAARRSAAGALPPAAAAPAAAGPLPRPGGPAPPRPPGRARATASAPTAPAPPAHTVAAGRRGDGDELLGDQRRGVDLRQRRHLPSAGHLHPGDDLLHGVRSLLLRELEVPVRAVAARAIGAARPRRSVPASG